MNVHLVIKNHPTYIRSAFAYSLSKSGYKLVLNLSDAEIIISDDSAFLNSLKGNFKKIFLNPNDSSEGINLDMTVLKTRFSAIKCLARLSKETILHADGVQFEK